MATGGDYAAGIGSGSGHNHSGSDITISGGNVTAKGGLNGAGIGAGLNGKASNITISGDAQVKVQGGAKDFQDGSGAGIGNGGTHDLSGNPKDSAELPPDTSKLTTNGKIEYYAPGADMSKDAPTKTISQQPVPSPLRRRKPPRRSLSPSTASRTGTART